MKMKILYAILLLVLLNACSKYDNYSRPSETLKGQLTDSATGAGFQTEVGDNGVRFKMMDYTYSSNPTAWYFTCQQDGSYQNTIVPAGTYNVTPVGAFVPLVRTGGNGDTTKNTTVTIAIDGTVTQNFTVAPFLVVAWVGDPVVNSDNTITAQFKVVRGTTDAEYQQDLSNIYLYVNSSSYDVGNNNYDSRYTVAVSSPNTVVGQTLTVTTPVLPYTNATYYLRAGARINYSSEGVYRYNYNEPVAVTLP